MRKEDASAECNDFLDILRNTLERELFEELGISVALDKKEVPFVIYTPDNEKSEKHLAIGWILSMDEDTKFRLDSYELVQKKGKTKSGSFIPFNDISNPDLSFESWSRTILLELFSDCLPELQRKYLKRDQSVQLKMF